MNLTTVIIHYNIQTTSGYIIIIIIKEAINIVRIISDRDAVKKLKFMNKH